MDDSKDLATEIELTALADNKKGLMDEEIAELARGAMWHRLQPVVG